MGFEPQLTAAHIQVLFLFLLNQLACSQCFHPLYLKWRSWRHCRSPAVTLNFTSLKMVFWIVLEKSRGTGAVLAGRRHGTSDHLRTKLRFSQQRRSQSTAGRFTEHHLRGGREFSHLWRRQHNSVQISHLLQFRVHIR